MANRNKGRRGRPRKRRPTPAAAAPGQAGSADGASAVKDEAPEVEPPAPHSARKRQRAPTRRAAAERGGAFRDPLSFGERPQAPWHPLPLSELLILVGAIATVVGLRRGISHGGPALFAGLAAVLIGTLEVTLREHLSGYRSHTIILAVLAVIVFHSAVALGVAAVTPPPVALNVALLALDVALFAFLFKLLRARFLDARRERTFAGRR